MKRVVDIESDDCHLSRHRGFLLVSKKNSELGRVSLDDIAAVITRGYGTTLSTNLLSALAERQIVAVICGANHFPASMVMPLGTHTAQGRRMMAQIGAKTTLKKRLWRQLISHKINMQACILAASHQPLEALNSMAARVRSGDPENLEAQAARRYWPHLMGTDFIRDRNQPGVNGQLNYGYAILRACCARELIATGLHVAMGIHHHAGHNNAALADDVMEPFRPFVDLAVWHLDKRGISMVTQEAKRVLSGLLDIDLPGPNGTSPLANCIRYAAQSLAACFEGTDNGVSLPAVPTAFQLSSIANLVSDHAP